MVRRWRRRKAPVPEVLRRACGGRVETLQSAILSFLPDPPPSSPLDCSCRGRGCLGCIGQSFLVRPADPTDYLLFVTRSFCSLSAGTSPFPVNFFASGKCLPKVRDNNVELMKGRNAFHDHD
ncbi:Telomerase reverse transcriptase [Apostasia shenzhenica]|uniref:Telomerase reverse transcriptase n=1 Tax=Apostasia shenzhenica TaxID=1088818 RepID=A0A2H9ZZI0_9ASPA|nr:Telomerase reverse transcriptase [Apostasia shenzhenica]